MTDAKSLAAATCCSPEAALDTAAASFKPTRRSKFVVHAGPGGSRQRRVRASPDLDHREGEALDGRASRSPNKPAAAQYLGVGHVMSEEGRPARERLLQPMSGFTDTLGQDGRHQQAAQDH